MASERPVVTFHPVYCRRCRASFQMPHLPAEERTRLADAFRNSGNRIEFIRLLREASHADLRDAKAAAMHFTKIAGICHRCGGSLDGFQETTCANCGSFNLDWPGG